MSTIAIAPRVTTRAGRTASATGSTARSRSTRLRLTARGRRVLAALAAFPAVAVLSVAIISGGGALASGDEATSPVTFDRVTVMPGESLWSIAQTVAPDADPRDVVDAIARLNALGGGQLQAGQTISIPLEYSAGR